MAETEPRRWRIAKHLKEARAQTQPRISQTQIAERLLAGGLDYFTERHASRLELGYMDATTSEVRALASVLKVSPDWLCGAAVPPVPTAPPQGHGLARASQAQAVPAAAAPAAAVAVAASKAPTAPANSWPACPDPSELERRDEPADVYRGRLGEIRALAQRMLHTSGLPAAPWRQWRELDRQIAERLRSL